jgi:uncharacterized protein
MLSFDIRSLSQRAVRVDGRLEAIDPVWEAGDARPLDAVLVTGRLSSAGRPGRFYFSGHLSGTVATNCRRCLSDLEVPVQEDVHLIYADADDAEADDVDVFHVDPRADDVDLRPAIREQWLLAVPAFPQCREDCKGLCPTCGADLNLGACSCASTTDSRWDALRAVRDRQS